MRRENFRQQNIHREQADLHNYPRSRDRIALLMTFIAQNLKIGKPEVKQSTQKDSKETTPLLRLSSWVTAED